MGIRKDTIQLSIEINGVKAGQTYKELRNNARDLTRELDKLEPGTEAFIRKTEELKKTNNVLATIRNQTKGVGHGFDEAGKKVNPFIDSLKKGAVAAVAFFSAQRVIEWGKQLLAFTIKGTAALEAMRAKSAIIFGDAIDIVEDYAALNAQAIGTTEEKYISFAASIADLLIPMKFTREEAAEMSTDLVNLSGALSEWTNGTRTAEEVNKILGKAVLGEREGLKELGISIKELDITQRLAAKGQKDLTGTALEQAKAIATLELITEKSTDAQTRFRINQEGTNRSMSRLNSILEKGKENYTKNILPFISEMTNRWADSVAPIKRHSDVLGESLFKFKQYLRVLQSSELTENERVKLLNQVNRQYKLQGELTLTLTSTREDYLAVEKKITEELQKQIKVETAKEVFLSARNKVIKAEVAQTVAVGKRIDAEQRLNDVLRNRDSIDDFGATSAADVLSANFSGAAENVEKAKQAVKDANREFDLATKALKEFGIDANELLKIINGGGTEDPDDPTGKKKKSAETIAFELEKDRIEELTQKRIAANDRLVQSDEVAAIKRKIIEIDQAQQIATARITIFSKAKLAEERLSLGEIEKLKNENNERDIERIQQQGKLTLQERTELIEQIRVLEIEALEELELTEAQKIRNIQIINQQALVDKRKAEVESAGLVGDALIAANRDVINEEKKLDKLRLENRVETTIEALELERDLTLLGTHELELDEEDFQKFRLKVSLEYSKKILQEQLKLASSAEAVAIKDKIKSIDQEQADIVFGVKTPEGGSSSPEDGGDEETFFKKLKDAAIQNGQVIAQGLFEIKRNRIESELQLELDAIDRIAEARLAAAGDDAVLQKKIQAEARRDKEKAEKEAARKRKDIALKEAIIQGALAVIEALPNPFAAVAAGIATAVQIATIESQTFAKGGYTPKKGKYRDNTGHEVVGVVHANEYVAAPWMLQDPRTAPHISYLEQVRQSRGGFAEGGFTTVSTSPATFNQSVVSTTAMEEKLDQMIALLHNVDMNVGAWPRQVKAVVSYRELEDFGADVQYIRDQANA